LLPLELEGFYEKIDLQEGFFYKELDLSTGEVDSRRGKRENISKLFLPTRRKKFFFSSAS